MSDRSQRIAAKVVALMYPFAFVIVTVAFFRFYVPLMVLHDPVATARNFAAHEASLRQYLAGALAYGLCAVVLLAALHVILRPIGAGLALFATACRLVFAVMWFTQMIDQLAALHLTQGAGYLATIDAGRREALAGLRLAAGWDAYYVGLGFYSLGTLAFAWLWLKSRYVPRPLAAFGLLGSAFAGFCGFAYLLFPTFGAVVAVDWYELPAALFELSLSIWLLARGLRLPQQRTPTVTPAIAQV